MIVSEPNKIWQIEFTKYNIANLIHSHAYKHPPPLHKRSTQVRGNHNIYTGELSFRIACHLLPYNLNNLLNFSKSLRLTYKRRTSRITENYRPVISVASIKPFNNYSKYKILRNIMGLPKFSKIFKAINDFKELLFP